MLKSPSVRFPEFDEVWSHTKAGEVFSNSRERGEEKLPIYSVTLNRGMVPRSDLTRKMQGDASFDKNLKVLKGNVAYNMMRMWQGAVGVAPKDCMVSPAYVVLNPNNDNVSEFFVQWFSLDRMLNLLTVYSRGLTSDRLRLYYEDFAQITIRVPSAKEQTKIAEFLGAVDEKIHLLEARNEQLALCKKAMMQKFFAQAIRFKREDGGDFPDWKERKFNEVLKEHKLKSTGKEKVHSVSVHKGVIDQIKHLGRSFAAANTDHYNRVLPGDVIYTKSPTGDFPYGIIKQSKLEIDAIVSPLYGVFTPETKALGKILNDYFLSVQNTNNYLRPIIQKGAKNTINITNTTFLSRSLTLPVSQKEQQKIADFLSAIDDKIDAVGHQVAQMRCFKKGLLQQMFV